MDEGDVMTTWQEFVIARQETIEKRIELGEFTSEYVTLMNQLDELLKDKDESAIDKVTRLVVIASYIHYNKGFFDGMKIALTMGNL